MCVADTHFPDDRQTTPPAQCMLGYTLSVDRQTPVKTLPSKTSFAGGKDDHDTNKGQFIFGYNVNEVSAIHTQIL